MNLVLTRRRLNAAAAGLLLLFSLAGYLPVLGPQKLSAQAANERLVSIFDGQKEQTVLTKAATVREALQRAGVSLTPADAVEPGLDTVLSGGNYNVNVYRARPVAVVDGPSVTVVLSPYKSPKQIAEQAGLTVYPEDVLSISRTDNVLKYGTATQKVIINRATPVNIVLYGKAVAARTRAADVAGLLREKQIQPGLQDSLSLPASQPISAGMSVEIWRNGIQTVNQEEPVDFSTRQIRSADQPVGFRQVQTAGRPGKKLVTYEIDMKNGREISRRIIQSVVTQPPAEQVEVIGIRPLNVFSGGLSEAMARLRQCEAGGRYDRNSGNGYYGAYQYNLSTWANWGGYRYPHQAPPAVQDAKALETYQRRGWQPWPACSRSLGLQDIYR